MYEQLDAHAFLYSLTSFHKVVNLVSRKYNFFNFTHHNHRDSMTESIVVERLEGAPLPSFRLKDYAKAAGLELDFDRMRY